MATRYTKKFIQARFEYAAKVVGWDIGPAYGEDGKPRIGAIYLDHNSTYGGWNIDQIVNDGGAIRQINGWCNRLSAGELIAFLDGLVMGHELANKRA